MWKCFFEQRMINYNGQWYCYLCKIALQSQKEAKLHSKDHSTLNAQTFKFPNQSKTSSKTYKPFVKNGIIMRDAQQDYFCVNCQCPIPNLLNIYQHISTKNHQECTQVVKKSKKKQRDSDGDASNKQSNVSAENSTERVNNVNNDENHVNTIVPENELQIITVNNDMSDNQEVSANALDRKDVIKHLLSDFRVETKSTNFFGYSCDQCKKIIEEDDIINHEITAHESDMKSSVRYIDDWSPATIKNFNIACHYPLFRCLFCNEIVHGVLSLATHLSGREHEENIQLLTEECKYDDLRSVTIHAESRELLSLVSFENDDGTVRIREQLVMYVKNLIAKDTKKFSYVCAACSRVVNKVTSHLNIIEHLCYPEHLKHFKDIFFTYSYIRDILMLKERSTSRTREVSSASTEDVSLSTKSLKKETQVNTERHSDDGLTAAAGVINKNDDQDEENDSGLFVSFDILADINQSICQPKLAQSHVMKLNRRSVLDRYNNMYSEEFLDFEEVMFACNEKKLNEMKLHLPFFVSHSDNMLCLVCNEPQLCNAQAVYEHINCEKHVTRFTQLHLNREHLELLKELIQPVRFQRAKCFACNEIFDGIRKKDSVDFKYHTRFPTHKNKRKQLHGLVESILEEFQDLYYKIQHFACVQCNTKFKQKIDFLKHLKASHKLVWNNKDNSMFDFCLTCASFWYDQHYAKEICISYRGHCQRSTHKYLQKSNDFAVTSLPQSLQILLKNVNGTAEELFNLSNDVLHDRRVVQVEDDLKRIFEIQWLEVYTFGSRVTGLALPNSDIDIFLNFGNESTEPEVIKCRSKQIQNCLRSDQENWNIELILNKSRTPIIKVKHRLTGLQCDISFMNGLSVENSKLIRSFNTAYPPCQKLTLFLKKWLSLGSLTGLDGITNYALVWLVIFYLQVKFQVPSIAALIKSHNQSKIVSGWETGVGDTILINVPKLPIHKLLLGFFEYYKNFNYMHFVICPLLGETYQKRAFAETPTLPDSMALYITQLQNKNPEYFRIDSPMCVQDPFDLSHNLTKAVSTLTLKRFKYYCNESSRVLQCIIATSPKKK